MSPQCNLGARLAKLNKLNEMMGKQASFISYLYRWYRYDITNSYIKYTPTITLGKYLQDYTM